MSRKLFFLLVSLLSVSSLWAQQYAGPNAAVLRSAGTQQSTEFEISQMVGRFEAGDQQLELMAKTGAMALQASPANQQLFEEIFQPQANRLLVIKADLSALTLSSTPQKASVPVEVQWNDQSVQTTVAMEVSLKAQSFTFDLDLTLPLSAVKLTVPGPHKGQFSDQITLSMEGATLEVR
jgi:hypothetical protein